MESSVYTVDQSAVSSLAKHGESYFWAVYGFMKGPIAALGVYENIKLQKLVAVAPAPTLFTTSANQHGFH